ncbi:MAG TPA: hypothetical protein VHM19_21695, partial [Polyangiales bacterium]|nr:hypothetical protein [Polyangiales bacterium]
MRRSWLLLPLTLFGCGPEIVLGDREAPLPVAGTTSSAGTESTAGASGSGGNGGSSSGGTNATEGGDGGVPSVEPLPVGDVLWSTDHE